MTSVTASKSIENVELLESIVREYVSSPRREKLLKLMQAYSTSLVTAPSSTNIQYHGAFAGGFTYHVLSVINNMNSLFKAYGIPKDLDAVITVGLLHDFGKLGLSPESPYFQPKMSDWHNRQGIMYETNAKDSLTVSQRSLFITQQYGIKLTQQEYEAISSIRDRRTIADESVPTGNESMFTVILQQAIKVSCMKNTGNSSLDNSERITFTNDK